LAYLRLIVNTKDEESLKRVINYPTRGIGQTTIDKLILAANHYKRSIFEIIENIHKLDLPITKGIQTKLVNFVNMIKSFQVIGEKQNAFELTDTIIKKTGLLQEFKKDGTPEGITRVENLEELLNGIRDFVEGQNEVADATGSLSEFLEDVALATDFDNEKGDDNHVSLMTVHMAKGLEFPYVFIVGMEEDLFPSAMSMNTRSELEEERRLFYVALTRAEKQAYITYTLSRYRWGKLIDAEPSRFIDEIDENSVELNISNDLYRYKPQIDADIFGEIDKSKLRQTKPKNGNPPPSYKPTEKQLKKLRKLKPTLTNSSSTKEILSVKIGQYVKHGRFGEGKVIAITGVGQDRKAEINFEKSGIKKLLLRFAKLEVI
jgi:DNA helicase-2/ATP-dependent DNA helicase PcrA